jgi:hypothetical protein
MLAEGREHRKFPARRSPEQWRDTRAANTEDCHQACREPPHTRWLPLDMPQRIPGASFLFFFFFYFPMANEQLHENSRYQRTDESDPQPQHIPALISKAKYQDAQEGHDRREKPFESQP